MRIAYIVPSLANKGPIIVVKDLVTMMIKNGHECVVFYFDDIHELNFSCKVKHISFWETIDFSNYDVVHTHGLRPDLYLCLHKPLKCKALCISTMHCFVFADLASQYNKFLAFAVGLLWMKSLFRHDKIVVLTRNAQEYYRKWLSPNKLYVAYNTRIINEECILSRAEKEEFEKFKGRSIVLGVNALLTPIKGIDQILKALFHIKGIKLWIVGDGKSKADLIQLAYDLNISDRVYFAGYRNNATRYLPYYDIYVMASRSEGFPLALLEAMAYKKRTICSNIPIFKEILSPEETTFFELENVSSLVDGIEDTLNTDKTIAIHHRFNRDYSPECFYQRYICIYK